MTEADVSSKLRVALSEAGAVAWKVSDRFHASRPDLVICYGGRFIAIETKMAPNIPTDLQTHTLTDLATHGAQVYVASYFKRDKKLALLDMVSGHVTSFTNIKEAALWIIKQSVLQQKKESLTA